jgi:drug/metabolite transporter (DMT)-like permease
MRVYIAFLVVLISWSTTPIAIQFSSDGIHFATALELRWLIAFPVAAITLLAMGQRIPLDRQSIIAYMVIAMPMTIGMCLTYYGAQRVPSGLIAVVFSLSPLVTGLTAQLVLTEPSLTPAKVLGLLIATAGIGLIFKGELAVKPEMLWGLIALFLTVVGFAMNAVAVKTVGKHLGAFEQIAGVMAAQLVFTLPVWFFYTGGELPQPSGKSMAAIVYLAIVGSVVTYAAYNYMLKNMRTVNSQLVSLLTPIFALIIGAKVAEESLSRGALLGIAVVLCGVAIFLFAKARPDAAHSRAVIPPE